MVDGEDEHQHDQPSSELDLCFICDCTGSMGSYIKAHKIP